MCRGLYANYNFSATQCQDTHVLTVDDDHEFPPDHWRCVREAVAFDPEAVWVIGEFYDWEQAERTVFAVQEIQPRRFSLAAQELRRFDSDFGPATVYPRQALSENRMIERFILAVFTWNLGQGPKPAAIAICQLSTTYVIHHFVGFASHLEKLSKLMFQDSRTARELVLLMELRVIGLAIHPLVVKDFEPALLKKKDRKARTYAWPPFRDALVH